MKVKYSDFFAESVIEEINNKIEELSKEAIEVLGFGNIAEEDFSKDQVQKIMEFIVNKEIFTKGENIRYFWMAIDDTNLTKINELKNNIDDKKYAKTLITSLLLNSIIRNDKVIKFLLTETEISQYPTLKAKIMANFLGSDNKSELNEEIIELLSIDNEAIFKKELSYFLWNSNIPDRLFIKSFENISDINSPLIRKVSYDQGQTFQDEKFSLLEEAIQSNRLELVQY
ncbi:MAG TPA: hypothetical protein LFW14_01910 [Rickettsia endosymbiont of Degeeriella rufa]|nr:hypothetical protein [Rickettsia endosymbiont of Degeeriella rufa]